MEPDSAEAKALSQSPWTPTSADQLYAAVVSHEAMVSRHEARLTHHEAAFTRQQQAFLGLQQTLTDVLARLPPAGAPRRPALER